VPRPSEFTAGRGLTREDPRAMEHNPTNNPAERQYGLPSSAPLPIAPSPDAVEAAEMWRVALRHVGDLAYWDRRISSWVSAKDGCTVATLASWLHRAWQHGHAVGRSDAAETPLTAGQADRLVALVGAPDATSLGSGAVLGSMVRAVTAAERAEQDDDGRVSVGMAAAVASVVCGVASVVALVGGLSSVGAYVGAAAAALGLWSLHHDDTAGGAS